MPRSAITILVLVALSLTLLTTTGCQGGESSGELLVAAAADLKYAFDEIGTLFEQQTGAKVTFSYGSSGVLAEQIEGGLPADIYSSADVGYVDRLRQKGLIEEDSAQVYAVGRLALASSRKAGVDVTTLEGLLQPEVKQVAIANPEHAPYGRAAEEALKSAGLWNDIQPKLVYGQNVRQATQYVESGDAEAGVVALSLAIDSPDVPYVLVDDSLHQPIRQSLAVIKGSENEALARRFIAFLRGPQGQAIMENYGFSPPKEE